MQTLTASELRSLTGADTFGRLEPERARHTTSAPRWMEGWDD